MYNVKYIYYTTYEITVFFEPIGVNLNFVILIAVAIVSRHDYFSQRSVLKKVKNINREEAIIVNPKVTM